MNKEQIERKINNLKQNLDYYERVYPRSGTIHKLKCRIYYYSKKLSSLCD